MPAGTADGAADPKIHGFYGARQMVVECIDGANLSISASPAPSGPRCAANGNIGYDIDGISRRLAPLWGDGGEDRQGAGWLDGHRGLDMDQICIGGQSSQGEVIAVREKRIEGSERTGAGVLVTCRHISAGRRSRAAKRKWLKPAWALPPNRRRRRLSCRGLCRLLRHLVA